MDKLTCLLDEFSEPNVMKDKQINFPQMLDGNSVWGYLLTRVDEISATRRLFRPRLDGQCRMQPIEIAGDDFSAMHESMAKPDCRFTAPREPSGLEVKLGLNRVIRKGRNC